MKVLSFDVGIKNLAYCVMEWNDTDNQISNLKILFWDIINLLESYENQIQTTNNLNCFSKDCNKKVKAFTEFNEKKYCFCTKHINNKTDLLNPILEPYDETNWIQIKNSECCKCSENPENPKKTKNTKTFFSNETLNFVLCNKHYKNMIGKLNTASTKLYPIKNKKVKDMTTDNLKFNLVKCLDQRKEILLNNADVVLIENQPSFKNPVMKAISDTLYTWFMIRGIVDKDINKSIIQKIRFISPSNKLKEFNQKSIEDASENAKYSATKKLSVINTQTILTSYELKNWLNVLHSHHKKDDMADCFLQGWYVLNITYENKLYTEWNKLYNDKVIRITDKEVVKEDVKENNDNLEVRTVKTKRTKKVKNVKTDNN